jgi:hypothetical protein
MVMDQRKRVRIWIGLYAGLLVLAAATLRAGTVSLHASGPEVNPPAELSADLVRQPFPLDVRAGADNVVEANTVTVAIPGLVDQQVIQGYPGANCTDALGGYVGYDQTLNPPGQVVRLLVGFSLAQIPPDAAISQATLEVFVGGGWGYTDESLPLNVHRLAEPWVPETTTWNNQPAAGGVLVSTLMPFARDHTRQVDLTNLVQKWHDGTGQDEGILRTADPHGRRPLSL